MELLIILAFLWVLWLINPQKRRRFFIQTLVLVLITCYVLASPWAVSVAVWGLNRSLPLDTGEPVDAIVVLGRGDELRPQRMDVVETLWAREQPPLIFASGMMDARIMVEQFHEHGIPNSNLLGEECSQSTQENALFTSVLLTPEQVKRVILVTDAPHMRRSLLSFQKQGFQVLVHPSKLPAYWKSYRQMQLVLREYAALVGYLLEDRINVSISRASLKSVDAALGRVVSWNCKVRPSNPA